MDDQRHHGRQPAGAHRLEPEQRFTDVAEGLADHQVGAGIGRPGHLFVEDRAHGGLRLLIGRVDVGIREVAGEQGPGVLCHLPGDCQCIAIERLE